MADETATETEPLVLPYAQRRQSQPMWLGLGLSTWIQIGVLGLLFLLTFYSASLRRLWDKTNPIYGEPNWSHAVCVPIIGIYYLYAHRRELLATQIKEAWSGLPILIGGLLLFGYGIYPGQNDTVKDLGMVMSLFGLVAFLLGWGVMRIAWFPIAFLVCAIPWPGLVYSWVAGPLQRLAAVVAVAVLKITGVAALSSGTKIVIQGSGGDFRTLNVAEACAGLRSLMTFITIGAAIAFLSSRPFWQKIVITVMAVPIAIFCNVMRVCGQGLLDHYWSQEWSQDFAHQFAGMVMLIPAFFLLLLVGWILDKLFIEVVERADGDVPMIPGLIQVPVGLAATPPRPIARAKDATLTPPAAKRLRVPRRKFGAARSTRPPKAKLPARPASLPPGGLPASDSPPAEEGGKP
jgi:exosortase